MGTLKKQARSWGADSLEIHTQFENAKLKKTMSLFGEITPKPGSKNISILKIERATPTTG